MVGEFPELQGVMGRYYALHDGEERLVADAIRDHYAPAGLPTRSPPPPCRSRSRWPTSWTCWSASSRSASDRPGAGDPYALRRAALGIIRIIRENGLRLHLIPLIDLAGQAWHHRGVHPMPPQEILDFLAERLRVQLRAEGARHDVLAAVFAAGADDDITRLLARTDAVAALLATDDGANLLTAYRRAANILRIESRKDGPHDGPLNEDRLRTTEEQRVASGVAEAEQGISQHLRDDDYESALRLLANLRAPLDAFFDKVTVNAPEPDLRQNRLRLLHKVRSTMDRIADFGKIEG